MEALEQALAAPAYPLFLGRRSCPPEGRLCLGIRRGMGLEEALLGEPPLAAGQSQGRIMMDAEASDILCRDVPLSFSQGGRRFGFRCVREETARFFEGGSPTRHDPMQELEG